MVIAVLEHKLRTRTVGRYVRKRKSNLVPVRRPRPTPCRTLVEKPSAQEDLYMEAVRQQEEALIHTIEYGPFPAYFGNDVY